jgi:hypothetical protein
MCAYLKNIHSNHCNRKKFVFFFSVLQEEREREREIRAKRDIICMYISEESLIINCKNKQKTKTTMNACIEQK